LTDLLKERLRTPEKKHGDLVDLLVEELWSEKPLIDEDLATDILAAILFASVVTISMFLTVGFKFLTDNPKVIESLKVLPFTMCSNNLALKPSAWNIISTNNAMN
jgi:cytochrome P450